MAVLLPPSGRRQVIEHGGLLTEIKIFAHFPSFLSPSFHSPFVALLPLVI